MIKDWKELLGQASPGPVKQTPLGIRYQANGFDKVKPKKVEKALGWLRNRNVPEHVLREFESYCREFCSSPSPIPQMIDRAYQEMKQKYVICGGEWAKAARELDPKEIFVVVEPSPIWSSHWNTWAAGLAWLKDRKIQAICVGIDGIMTNPAQAGSVRKFPDLMRWEMGNLLSFLAGHRIKSPLDELGDKSPCGR